VTGERFTPPSAGRSPERDERVRVVSRTTRAIAALAVLGTMTFGALAAAGTSSTALAPPAVASSASGSPAGGSSVQGPGTLAAPASAPVSSAQAPVVSSGGS
jgi:hypothetical protein